MLTAVLFCLTVATNGPLTPEAATEVRRAEEDMATATRLLARSRTEAEVAMAEQIMELATQRRRLAIDSCRPVVPLPKVDPYADDPWDPAADDGSGEAAWLITEQVAREVMIRMAP